MPSPVDTSTSPAAAQARRMGGAESRLGQAERARLKTAYFTDSTPTGAGNPPKPSGSPPNGTIAVGYYPNKTAGSRTWLWARANGEWSGVNLPA